MSDQHFEQGMQIRRAVLGNAHVDRAEANKTDFDADFQRMIVEFAWGSVWAGDEIDRTTRHLITIAILAALGKEQELTLHLRATQNTGVTPTQLKAALHQVAVYAGIPAANTAFGIAKKVLAELEEKTERQKTGRQRGEDDNRTGRDGGLDGGLDGAAALFV